MAFDLANDIFDLSKQWPAEERYALTDQVRRSSRSICANLSEAWAKRPYPKHFVSKMTDAEGEALETRTWLAFAEYAGYISRDEMSALQDRLAHVIASLVKMRSNPAAWHIPTNVREEQAAYLSDDAETSHIPRPTSHETK
jgi:four helix bundle protein